VGCLRVERGFIPAGMKRGFGIQGCLRRGIFVGQLPVEDSEGRGARLERYKLLPLYLLADLIYSTQPYARQDALGVRTLLAWISIYSSRQSN
jgi:hypothetical protein